MAFDPDPIAWIPSSVFADDEYTLILPYSGTASADVRALYLGLCTSMADGWDTKDAADLPTKMTVSRSSYVNSDETITRTFAFAIVTEIDAQEVDDE